MGIVLGEEDQVKLKMASTTASRFSGKSSYTTWLRFFDEGDDNHSDSVVVAFLAY